MKIDYLEKLDFLEIVNIEELKTSRGQVKFDYDEQGSKINGPDLRYFWDGERFGLHVSDFGSNINIPDLFERLSNFQKNLEILYLSNIESTILEFSSINFPVLKKVYISNCLTLKELKFVPTKGSTTFEKGISSNIKKVATVSFDNFGNPLEELRVFDCNNLSRIEFTGNFEETKKIEIINCVLKDFKVPKKCLSLSYLNLSNNKISSEIDLSEAKALEYFFAVNNKKLQIIWANRWIYQNFRILGLDSQNELISKDILEIAKNSTDKEFRENLKAYLKFEQKHEENSKVPINRYQLILLGNTTSGKTELRHRLFNEKRKDNGSTHGVSFFSTIIKDIEIFGYDFGGQDYYHALHLPFFDFSSHYILVWGNYDKKSWGEFGPDNYWGGLEITEEREENVLNYPLKYWIKSIEFHVNSQDFLSYNKDTFSKDERNDERFLNNYFNFKTIEILNEYKNDPEREKIYSDDTAYITLSKKPKLDIVHNRRENQKERFLNVKDLKEIPRILVDEIKSFNFLEDEIGIWLREKIKKENLLQKNEILIEIKELGEELISSPSVIIEESTLKEKIKKINSNYDDRDVFQFTKSLINYHYIIYHDFKIHEQKDKIYVTNVEKFTQYLYQVLNKELLSSDTSQGYFSKEDAYERIKTDNTKLKEYILQFLLESNIIFEVNESSSENKRYFAPTYLPPVKDKVEKLFLQSFEEPDCKFELTSFFHPNLMLKVVKEYQRKRLLVKDEGNNEFLIWKNCVIIYNLNENSKQFLKLELLLPNKENPALNPTFTISRSSAGFIENDQFSIVFKEIHRLLSSYSPIIKVKSNYGKYIPFDDLQKLILEGAGKRSPFVYSDGVLYPKYDFRHYLGDEFNAPLKIFIAYSKYDDTYRLELRDHLYPSIAEGKFIVFDDREMDLGEKWHARLKKELEQCDVFVVLMSVKTLGTPYIMNVEIPEAIKRFKNGSLKIIPILVSECDWTKTGLNEFNVFDKAQSITATDEYFNLSDKLGINERAVKWKEIVKYIENLTPNGFNPTNSPTPSNEPVSGAN